jgi:hypothetical protein
VRLGRLVLLWLLLKLFAFKKVFNNRAELGVSLLQDEELLLEVLCALGELGAALLDAPGTLVRGASVLKSACNAPIEGGI